MRSRFSWSQMPLKEAISFFQEKRNVETSRWSQVLGIEQDAVFMSAGAKGALLSDLRKAVDRAISDAVSLDQFKKDFDQIVALRGWQPVGGKDWRANLIWETNLRTAYGAGREEQLERVKATRPFSLWKHGGSGEPRSEHLANDGKVFRFEDRPTRLPHGFGCRCQWLSLSQRDMDRLGLTLSDPLTIPEEPGWSKRIGIASSIEKQALRQQLLERLHPQISSQVTAEIPENQPQRSFKELIELGKKTIDERDLR